MFVKQPYKFLGLCSTLVVAPIITTTFVYEFIAINRYIRHLNTINETKRHYLRSIYGNIMAIKLHNMAKYHTWASGGINKLHMTNAVTKLFFDNKLPLDLCDYIDEPNVIFRKLQPKMYSGLTYKYVDKSGAKPCLDSGSDKSGAKPCLDSGSDKSGAKPCLDSGSDKIKQQFNQTYEIYYVLLDNPLLYHMNICYKMSPWDNLLKHVHFELLISPLYVSLSKTHTNNSVTKVLPSLSMCMLMDILTNMPLNNPRALVITGREFNLCTEHLISNKETDEKQIKNIPYYLLKYKKYGDDLFYSPLLGEETNVFLEHPIQLIIHNAYEQHDDDIFERVNMSQNATILFYANEPQILYTTAYEKYIIYK